jgi:ATP-binding cassette, subfamily C (CFTR/MRP), member 1
LQLVLLALVASENDPLERRLGIPASVIDLVAAVLLVGLSHVEHMKTTRPSFLTTAYLFCTVFFDVARVRTEWLEHQHIAFAGVLSAAIAVKLILLGLESVEKRHQLIIATDEKLPLSTESTSGPFNRGFFIWLTGLLRTGYATLLTVSSLPAIYERLQSSRLGSQYEAEWQRRALRSKIRKYELLLCVIHCLRGEILQVAFPRLAAVALSLSQPFLIREAVAYVRLPSNQDTTNLGYGLIGAFALVFICAAVCHLPLITIHSY